VEATYWQEVYFVGLDGPWVLAVNHHHFLIGLGEPAETYVGELAQRRRQRVGDYSARLRAATSGAARVDALRVIRQDSNDSWLETNSAVLAALQVDAHDLHRTMVPWWAGDSNDTDLAVLLAQVETLGDR
jgi:hypothetical protein